MGDVLTVQANGSLAPAAGGGGSSPVKTATVLLTSAQILALDSVPVTLVAGVPGSMLVPLVFSYSTDGGTPYTNGGANRAQVGDVTGFLGTLGFFGTLISDPDNSSPAFDLPGFGTGGAAANGLAGGDIQIAAGAPNTDGDFDVTVTVLYQQVPVP